MISGGPLMSTTPLRYSRSLTLSAQAHQSERDLDMLERSERVKSSIQRDYLDSSVPRFRDVSPNMGLGSKRRFRIKPHESPLHEHPNSSLPPAIASSRGKRERSQSATLSSTPVSTTVNNQDHEPKSGGRWMISALRRVPLLGALVGSQEDHVLDKPAETNKSSSDLSHYSTQPHDLNDPETVYITSSVPHISCDVVASPSFRSLADHSVVPLNHSQSFGGPRDTFAVPMPYDAHLSSQQDRIKFKTSDPVSTHRFQKICHELPIYANDLEEENDLKHIMDLRKKYGLGSLNVQHVSDDFSDTYRGKKQKLSPSQQTSFFPSTCASSWDVCATAVGDSSEQGSCYRQADIPTVTDGATVCFRDPKMHMSIASFRKRRGLRAVDYRRLLRQAKFQPCHWIDYFDYIKAKNADDEDQRHFDRSSDKPVVSQITTTDVKTQASSTNFPSNPSLLDSSRTGPVKPNSSVQRLVPRLAESNGDIRREPTNSVDRPHTTTRVSDTNSRKRRAEQMQSASRNSPSLVSSVRETRKRMSTEPKISLPSETLVSSDTSKDVNKGASRVTEPLQVPASAVCATKSVPNPSSSMPWWQANLNKDNEVPVEEDGVFAEDDNGEATTPLEPNASQTDCEAAAPKPPTPAPFFSPFSFETSTKDTAHRPCEKQDRTEVSQFGATNFKNSSPDITLPGSTTQVTSASPEDQRVSTISMFPSTSNVSPTSVNNSVPTTTALSPFSDTKGLTFLGSNSLRNIPSAQGNHLTADTQRHTNEGNGEASSSAPGLFTSGLLQTSQKTQHPLPDAAPSTTPVPTSSLFGFGVSSLPSSSLFGTQASQSAPTLLSNHTPQLMLSTPAEQYSTSGTPTPTPTAQPTSIFGTLPHTFPDKNALGMKPSGTEESGTLNGNMPTTAMSTPFKFGSDSLETVAPAVSTPMPSALCTPFNGAMPQAPLPPLSFAGTDSSVKPIASSSSSSSSIFGTSHTSTGEQRDTVSNPFEPATSNFFSFGGTPTASTQDTPVRSLFSGNSSNPFVGSGAFGASGSRRPKLRLKRTLH